MKNWLNSLSLESFSFFRSRRAWNSRKDWNWQEWTRRGGVGRASTYWIYMQMVTRSHLLSRTRGKKTVELSLILNVAAAISHKMFLETNFSSEANQISLFMPNLFIVFSLSLGALLIFRSYNLFSAQERKQNGEIVWISVFFPLRAAARAERSEGK